MATERWPISLAIITLNEESNIERCIRSAPFVSDIVVLDSGSQDKTVELARQLGARVFQEPWQGYSKQKTRATELAQYDWVLSLDADEALSPEAQQELTLWLKRGPDVLHEIDALALPRLTHYLGRWMRHSGMYPDYQTRFYNRKQAKWLDTNVHEHVVAKRVKKLKAPIFHWPFKGVVDQIETINRYSSLRALDFKKKGKRFSSWRLLLKPLSKFFETYIIKQGFRDGVQGLLVAMVSAIATFLRWAKLYELEQREPKD